VIIDLGTGDGRAVLARARSEPDTLVIGIDAATTAMAEASRRADRRGLRNALFLVAGVESLTASPIAGAADLVTLTFPWGSLLRGALGRDAAALAGIAAVAAPGARISVLTSVIPADGVEGITRLGPDAADAIATAWSEAGLRLAAMRPAAPAEVAASGSSWGRRLGAERPVWRLEGERRSPLG
jgi:16S rRNA (adenine(1408)-N(1))-methyltransferase